MTLDQLNQLFQDEFVAQLGAIFEHSPWVAEGACDERPFASVDALHAAMTRCVKAAGEERQLALIRAHPDLGSRAKMADASVQEQAGAGMNQLTPDEFEEITRLNAQYTQRFGFPFIFAVKGKTKADIFESIKARVHHDPQVEFDTALEQIYRIALFRLKDLINAER
jgi:2-oxo-4-hydroxy-4-carboxy-5-ureidoimidazoline decarboxylase